MTFRKSAPLPQNTLAQTIKQISRKKVKWHFASLSSAPAAFEASSTGASAHGSTALHWQGYLKDLFWIRCFCFGFIDRITNIKLNSLVYVPPQGKGVEAKRLPTASWLSGQNTHFTPFTKNFLFSHRVLRDYQTAVVLCEQFLPQKKNRPAKSWVWKK